MCCLPFFRFIFSFIIFFESVSGWGWRWRCHRGGGGGGGMREYDASDPLSLKRGVCGEGY